MELTIEEARRFARAVRRAFSGLLDAGEPHECSSLKEAVDAVSARLFLSAETQPSLAHTALERVRAVLDRPNLERDHPLDELLPEQNRHYLWRRLRRAFPGALPPLMMSPLAYVLGGLIGGLAGAMFGGVVVAGVLGAAVGALAVRPLGVVLPLGRVGDVVDAAVARPASLKRDERRWTTAQVEEVLRMAGRRAGIGRLDEATAFPPGTLIG